MSDNNKEYKLTYFDMKGLAEPIRMMFAVAGVDYEDIRIQREEWPQKKENYTYGQLPVLEVGGKQLAQSNAITRFLAKKFNLSGGDEFEAAKIDELAEVLIDLRAEWRKFFMEKDEAKKEELRKSLMEVTVPKYVGKAEAIKKENGGDFLVGQSLSFVDLQFAHFLELFVKTTSPDVMAPYPSLLKLQKTVYEVPAIAAWLEKRPDTEY